MDVIFEKKNIFLHKHFALKLFLLNNNYIYIYIYNKALLNTCIPLSNFQKPCKLDMGKKTRCIDGLTVRCSENKQALGF